MKRKSVFVFLFFINSMVCCGQVMFQKTYENMYGAISRQILVTNDNGFIILGRTVTFNNNEVYLIRTNSLGNLIWSNYFGGADNDWGGSIIQTHDSGFIVLANIETAGDPDIHLIKIDSLGNFIWDKTYESIGAQFAYSIAPTSDSGFIICGSHSGNSSIIIRSDSNGDTLWTKIFDAINFEDAFSVKQTLARDFIVTGRTKNFGAGDFELYLMKINLLGSVLWAKTYGLAGVDEGYSIIQTPDSGYIIAGKTTSSGAGNSDAYLLKADSNGNVSWNKTYGGPGDDNAYSVEIPADGGFIICGSTTSFGAGNEDLFLIRTDNSGDTIWTKTYGGPGEDCPSLTWDFPCVQITQDSSFIVSSNTRDSFSPYYEIYLVKTDRNGNSGCYEDPAAFVQGSPNFQVSNFTPSVIYPYNPVITTSSHFTQNGGTEQTLCMIDNISKPELSLGLIVTPTIGRQFITVTSTSVIKNIHVYNMLGAEELAVPLPTAYCLLS